MCITWHTHCAYQMVGLYRDPEGKQVFAKSDPKSIDIQCSSETDNLRRRVRELETVVGWWDGGRMEVELWSRLRTTILQKYMLVDFATHIFFISDQCHQFTGNYS